MKKGLALLLALVILGAGLLPVSALEKYTLDELDVRMALPEGYIAVTRDTEPDDPVFGRLGIDGAEILGFMEDNNIYLDAFLENDLTQELTVTMTAQPGQEDFALMEDEDLFTLIDTYMPHYQSGGVLTDGYQIYRHPQAKFVVLEFYNMVKDVCGLQFYTVRDEKAMNFTMHANGQELEEGQKAAMDALMSGLEFSAKAEAFAYTDDKTGLTFTVPAGWEEADAPEGLDLRLISQKEEGQSISYGSMDLFAQLTDADRKKYNRSDIDNDYYTRARAADVLGVAESEVEDAVYNGVAYFRARRPGTDAASQKEVIQLICVENGWMHLFTFGGALDSACYDDFESLLESAEYPAAGSSPDDGEPSGDASPFGGSVALVLLIGGGGGCDRRGVGRYPGARPGGPQPKEKGRPGGGCPAASLSRPAHAPGRPRPAGALCAGRISSAAGPERGRGCSAPDAARTGCPGGCRPAGCPGDCLLCRRLPDAG